MTVHEFKDTTYAGLRVTRFMVADADGKNIATFENGNSKPQHRIFTTRKGAEKYIAIDSYGRPFHAGQGLAGGVESGYIRRDGPVAKIAGCE